MLIWTTGAEELQPRLPYLVRVPCELMTTERADSALMWRCEPPRRCAEPGEVHLWMDNGHAALDFSAIGTSGILSADERTRQSRYVGLELQARFERRRAMLRHVLSHYRSDVLPEEWQFVHNAQGRPAIDPRIFGRQLHFNLSYSRNRTLLAIAACVEVGVDIEHAIATPEGNHLDVAEQFFTSTECCWINQVAKEKRMHRFFDLWTLKESYIKARGLGLSLALDDFQFAISDAGAVVLQELNRETATGRQWQFSLNTLHDHYRYAVALRCSEPKSLEVRRFDFSQCLPAF